MRTPGYLPPDSPDSAALVAEAEHGFYLVFRRPWAEPRLLASIVLWPQHVLRPLFPPVLTRRPGVCPRPHDLTTPIKKDDYNCIPKILNYTLLD